MRFFNKEKERGSRSSVARKNARAVWNKERRLSVLQIARMFRVTSLVLIVCGTLRGGQRRTSRRIPWSRAEPIKVLEARALTHVVGIFLRHCQGQCWRVPVLSDSVAVLLPAAGNGRSWRLCCSPSLKGEEARTLQQLPCLAQGKNSSPIEGKHNSPRNKRRRPE